MTIKPSNLMPTRTLVALSQDQATELLKNKLQPTVSSENLAEVLHNLPKPAAPVKPTPMGTPKPVASPESLKLIARSFYKELRRYNLTPNQVIQVTSEILGLLTQDIEKK